MGLCPVRARVSRGLVALVAILLLPGIEFRTAAADDSLHAGDPLLSVRLAPLERLYDSPIAVEVWNRLQSSRSFQESLATVEARQLDAARVFLEERLERPGREILSGLTAGGADVALIHDDRPQLLVVARTESKPFASEVVELVVDLTRANGQTVEQGEHRGVTGYRIGNAAIAAMEDRLLLGSSPELLKGAVDHFLDNDSRSEQQPVDEPFEISLRVDLDQLRDLPDVAAGLKFPADDAGAVTLMGGWIDLLRRHQTATLELRLEDSGLDALVRTEGAEQSAPAALAGFWADRANESPAPLLRLPGTIYSASWYRDYGALWDAREELVTAEVVQQLERADSEAAAQFETLGSAVSLSEVVQQLGPRFRIVVAQQPVPPYDFELRNQLPAAALVIELRDEDSFREIADPLARVVHLILSFEQKITAQPIEYEGAVLHRLSQPHTPRDIARRDAVAYNFRPAHTISRGHFILGTTPQIVEQVIVALDEQADAAPEPPADTTSEQFVDLRELSTALERLRDGIVRQSVLERGLDVETAGDDLDVLLSILELFESQTIRGVFTENGFEQRINISTR